MYDLPRPLIALFLVLAPAAAAQDGRNHPPRLRVDFPADAWVEVGETVRFSVRAFDPDGDAVSLRVTPVDSATQFQPAAAAGPEVEREFRYTASHVASGIARFTFEAWDDVQPERRTRRTVTLRLVGAFGFGISSHSSIDLGDVTGDGLVDVVVSAREADGALADSGAVYVWAGTTQPGGAPTAVLTASNALAGQRLGTCAGDGTKLADVTGDGVLDVVVGSARASAHGSPDAGAIYVFRGGPALAGARTEDALLVAPASSPSRLLGASDPVGGDTGEQGILIFDIDGDGAEDVLASAPLTDVAGVLQAGAVYLWMGADVSGTVEADLVLTGSNPFPGQFGGGGGQVVQLRELTGDGVTDVVVSFQGEILVWSGAALAGGTASANATPTARLSPGGYWMNFADVTGDGTLDVVARTIKSTQMYVFRGGELLSGDVRPHATLTSDAFPIGWPFAYPQFGTFGLRIEDVTFDGVPDVMTPYGALYVYAGGERMQGRVRPTLRLEGFGFSLFHLAIEDVTGDGHADFVNAPVFYVFEGDVERGERSGPPAASSPFAVGVWRNAPGVHGRKLPDAQLTDPLMNLANPAVRDVQVADCDGDGVPDVLAAIGDLEIDPQPGHVAFWSGGDLHGQVPPTGQLAAPSGFPYVVPLPPADVTGDGVADALVAEAYTYLFNGSVLEYPQELYLWHGGAGLAQAGAPDASFSTPGSMVGYTLVVDRDGDGVLDVLAIRSTQGSGVLYEWPGGPALMGAVPPSGAYSDPTEPVTEFGFFQSLGTFFLDLDGDGALDILSGSQFADTGPVPDTGALYRWLARQGALLFERLAVPGAQPFDQLGS